MVSGDDVDDSDVVGIVASDIDDDVAARQEKATTSGEDFSAGANATVIIGTARSRRRNDHVVRTPNRFVALIIFILARTCMNCEDSSLSRREKIDRTMVSPRGLVSLAYSQPHRRRLNKQ
jgi:hypothetical protein